MKIRIALLFLLLATIAAAYQTIRPKASAAPPSLAAYVPQDALLSIESPDFAALLHQWNDSSQAKTWLSSANYSVFQNSRLYGRLTDAQAQFAKVAGVPAGADLLNQVAGKQSIFAWYDVGRLEFLYITRMPAAQANQTQLLQSSAGFQRRHAGNNDFYIRDSSQTYSTVAFAQVSTTSGDLLLLATREDLIANALALIAANATVPSLAQDPWFVDASAALPSEDSPPALHMVLNLDRIVPLPYFRSYWVQQNITWMKQFRAAVSDLYMEPTRFREERVLLPKSSEESASKLPDISALASMVPAGTGAFRAFATQDPAIAVTAIEERLLGAHIAAPLPPEFAPDPSLEAPQAGSAPDLEARIDTRASPSGAHADEALHNVLRSANLDAVLTLSTAQSPPTKEALWAPIRSAVVLHAATEWNLDTLASALQQSLRGSLTAANLGIDFRPDTISGTTIYALTGPRSLFFAVPSHGNLVLLTDDRPLLLSLLQPSSTRPVPSDASADLIAGFDHSGQRAPYLRLTALIDGNNPTSPGQTPETPAFFSRNIGSLSDTFAAMQEERLVQRTVNANLRQTVLYTWQGR